MRVLSWLLTLLLFVAALGFALSNTGTAELRFFVGEPVRAPLVVFLLAFLAAGVALGLLAAVPTLFRHRREIARLRKELRVAPRPPQGPAAPEIAASSSTRLGV